MKLIVWLGNPGKEYENTRHNVGFILIEKFRSQWDFSDWSDSKFHAVTAEWMLSWEKILLMKPLTYMNLSGNAVSSIVNFYKLNPKEDILVISDDIDMEFGKVRFRTKGSHGWQNWLKDIITKLWTDEFARIKIGIGRHEKIGVSDWVLSKLSQEELDILGEEVFQKVRSHIPT